MTTAQYEHKPCIWMFDTETNEIIQHFIPILPISEVFKPEAEEIKNRNEKMEAFIKLLPRIKSKEHKSFEDNVKTLLKSKAITEPVREQANNFISEYYT
jgi:hypothetical protein